MEKFSDMEFRSSIMFPLVKLSKQGRSWIFKVAIGNQLYSYSYPFVFKNSLCNYQSTYDLLIKFKIIVVLSTTDLFDVPVSEKAQMKSAIELGLKGSHLVLFFNNIVNR